MGWVDRLEAWVKEQKELQQRTEPRRLEQTDVEKWFNAAEQQIPPMDIEQVRREIQMRNPVRWRRLQKELRWVEKQMKKMGRNPEDARWIL